MSKKITRVEDIMRPDFVLVDGLETLARALAILAESNADCMIVDKRHDNDEYGIVQLSTIVTDVLAVNRSVERINVYELMIKPVVTLDPRMNIRYCARMFANYGITIAPVVRDDEIIGVVSYRELAFGSAGHGLADSSA